MRVKSYGLGCASYLIGDEHEGTAIVVDPAFAIEQYLDEARRQHVTITRVLETHTHADHLSGHGRLALEHGCTVAIHPAAEPAFAHEALEDGATIDVGDVSIRVVHTPGHRPEHSAFTVTDRSRGDEPWLVLTGDSLFVGDVARPDLAVESRTGAEGLFHSLRKLTELHDGVEVYPGHVAGSLCGAGMSTKASSTIGFERRFNPALRILDEETFALGHAHGAINVTVDGTVFATKAAFLLDADETIVVHASTREEAERAAEGLRSVALLELAGYVLDPPQDERLAPIELDEVERLLAAGAIEVLDVREKDERDGGYIAGTRHIPYRLLRVCGDRVGEKPVVTICNTGARAAIAARS